MPQVAAEGVAFRDEWPFAIHLLGHIYADDINSARFLWKSIPAAIKESQPELVLQPGKLVRISCGQGTMYAGVHEAIRGFDWSQETPKLYTKRMFGLLLCICLFNDKHPRCSSIPWTE
ncbi:CSN8/PSMD8/EIF3K - like 5 [Theobroma cacao]|nr:CSN8/PSMD8/EIF3K - like 5 [Theobroma cacao]